MSRTRSSSLVLTTIALVTAISAAAQADDFYAGKTLRILVGVEAGGTVDTLTRLFAGHLRKHIPGNPVIVIQFG